MLKPLAVGLMCAALFAPVAEAAAQSARTMYTRALGAERVLRDGSRQPTLRQLRAAVESYERVVRRYPKSGYCDNALWQAGNLALLAFERFGEASDRRMAQRLLNQLRAQYPSSSLASRAGALVREREAAAAAPPRRSGTRVRTNASVPSAPVPLPTPNTPDATRPGAVPASSAAAAVTIRDVRRTELPDGARVTIELDGEVAYHSERVEHPQRVFFDLQGTRPSAVLGDSTLRFDGQPAAEVRVGRHPGSTRVVMNMEGAESYSVFTLYDPFRIIVDFKRSASVIPPPSAQPRPSEPPTPVPPAELAAAAPRPLLRAAPAKRPPVVQADAAAEKDVVISAGPVPVLPPSAASANANGKFSLARQLGLGVSRVVIDAGHGGHDPGARANGVSEAELTLDVAQRVQKLLEKQAGIEVLMTRATDVFIPLEERTRIANREGADLFLSIHANASRNTKARGVETYFLNFATNPEAEAVAARENAGSVQTMGKLPEIVRAIAMNNKIKESRDFADMVQRSMVRRLASRNKAVRDIGIKQAPFVVLIGAQMPSVLAEMSFVTNKQEAALLKTGAYRQQIAEALVDAVLRYQQSLKKLRSASTTQTSSR